MAASTSQPGLLAEIQGFLAAGKANGWQSFGTSSAWDANEKGQDIGVSPGVPIFGPAGGGTVVGVNQTWAGTGNGQALVSVKDNLGNIFNIGHITPNVKVGQQVGGADVLGFSGGFAGATSSGPHIEFQVQPAGSSVVVDPVEWLSGLDAITGVSTATPTTTSVGSTGSPGSPPSPGAPTTLSFGDSLKRLLIEAGLVVLALVLLILGVMLLNRDNIGDAIKDGIKALPAAVAA